MPSPLQEGLYIYYMCTVHCSQITVTTVEEIELLKEEVMSSPVLLRVWAEFVNNDYIGAATIGPQFEGRPNSSGYCAIAFLSP